MLPSIRALVVLVALFAVALGGCSTKPPVPPRAIELNRDGALALAAGDLTTAHARLELATEYSPRFTEAWVNLGLVEMQRGNLDLAYKHLRRARDLNGDLPAPHHAIGLLAQRRGLDGEAEKSYKEALVVDPGFAPARANLARMYYGQGRFDAARLEYLKLTQAAPRELAGHLGLVECLWKLEREGEADEALGRARERFGDVPDLRVLVARQLLRRDAPEDAEEILAPLTQTNDRARAATAWAWIGVARLSRGDHGGAAAAAREGARLDANEPVGRWLRAKLSAGG